MVPPPKTSKGRQRVEMVRMQKESNRLVTFSKRRSGLFKKASELCTLTGSEAAVIVFSPGRKAYSFGHPSVDNVINRFMGNNRGADAVLNNCDARQTERFNHQLTLLTARIEGERKQHEEHVKVRKAKAEQMKWLTSIEELGLEELKQLLGPISELRAQVIHLGNRLILESSGMEVQPPIEESKPTGSIYQIPPGADAMGGQNPFTGPNSVLMVPNPMGRGPNDHPSMVMVPTPSAAFGDPSLSIRPPNGLGIAINPSSTIRGFDAPNGPPFERVAHNPIGGQRDGPPMPFNMGMINPPVPDNPESFTSLLMGPNPIDAQNEPAIDLNVPIAFNHQGRFGFGHGFF